MYIVVTTPVSLGLNSASLTIPGIEYFQTKEQLIERLKKGGNIRVYEATELQFKLDVTLVPKDDAPSYGIDMAMLTR